MADPEAHRRNLLSQTLRQRSESGDPGRAFEAAVNEWARKHWHDRHCPICGETEYWTLGDVVELRDWGDVLNPHTDAYPTVQIACGNCGYVLFVNAVIAQLPTLDELEDQESPPPEIE